MGYDPTNSRVYIAYRHAQYDWRVGYVPAGGGSYTEVDHTASANVSAGFLGYHRVDSTVYNVDRSSYFTAPVGGSLIWLDYESSPMKVMGIDTSENVDLYEIAKTGTPATVTEVGTAIASMESGIGLFYNTCFHDTDKDPNEFRLPVMGNGNNNKVSVISVPGYREVT
jgi:hypothetical protein